MASLILDPEQDWFKNISTHREVRRMRLSVLRLETVGRKDFCRDIYETLTRNYAQSGGISLSQDRDVCTILAETGAVYPKP